MSDLHHMVSVHKITPLKSTSSLLPKANILQIGSSVIILMNLGINGIMNIREIFFIERVVHLKTIIFQICQK